MVEMMVVVDMMVMLLDLVVVDVRMMWWMS